MELSRRRSERVSSSTCHHARPSDSCPCLCGRLGDTLWDIHGDGRLVWKQCPMLGMACMGCDAHRKKLLNDKKVLWTQATTHAAIFRKVNLDRQLQTNYLVL